MTFQIYEVWLSDVDIENVYRLNSDRQIKVVPLEDIKQMIEGWINISHNKIRNCNCNKCKIENSAWNLVLNRLKEGS